MYTNCKRTDALSTKSYLRKLITFHVKYRPWPNKGNYIQYTFVRNNDFWILKSHRNFTCRFLRFISFIGMLRKTAWETFIFPFFNILSSNLMLKLFWEIEDNLTLSLSSATTNSNALANVFLLVIQFKSFSYRR